MKEQLTLKEVALLYYYHETLILNNPLADKIAELYGYSSGHKLSQLRGVLDNPLIRLCINMSVTIKNNQIKRIQNIIPHITSATGKQNAITDIDLIVRNTLQ